MSVTSMSHDGGLRVRTNHSLTHHQVAHPEPILKAEHITRELTYFLWLHEFRKSWSILWTFTGFDEGWCFIECPPPPLPSPNRAAQTSRTRTSGSQMKLDLVLEFVFGECVWGGCGGWSDTEHFINAPHHCCTSRSGRPWKSKNDLV